MHNRTDLISVISVISNVYVGRCMSGAYHVGVILRNAEFPLLRYHIVFSHNYGQRIIITDWGFRQHREVFGGMVA